MAMVGPRRRVARARGTGGRVPTTAGGAASDGSIASSFAGRLPWCPRDAVTSPRARPDGAHRHGQRAAPDQGRLGAAVAVLDPAEPKERLRARRVLDAARDAPDRGVRRSAARRRRLGLRCRLSCLPTGASVARSPIGAADSRGTPGHSRVLLPRPRCRGSASEGAVTERCDARAGFAGFVAPRRGRARRVSRGCREEFS